MQMTEVATNEQENRHEQMIEIMFKQTTEAIPEPMTEIII